MRKRVLGRHLGRDKNQRLALFRGLISDLIRYGSLETTLAKAKSIRPQAEKLITKAIRGDMTSRRQIAKIITHGLLVSRLVDVIGPVFKDTKGGYLRITRTIHRLGDRAPMAKVSFTKDIPETTIVTPKSSKLPKLPKPPKSPKSPKTTSTTNKKAAK